MHNYAGNASLYPANIGLVDDADLNPASASTLDVAPTNLADRTAFLHANSLFITGGTMNPGAVLTVSTGGVLNINNGADLAIAGVAFVTGLLEIGAAGTCQFDAGSTLQGTVSHGTLSLAGASLVANANGSITSNILSGVKSVSPGGISATTAGGIMSLVDGGIEFGGSATDWGLVSPTRTKSYTFIPHPLDFNQFTTISATGNWSFSNGILQGRAQNVAIAIPIESPHDGGNLTTVIVSFVVADPHAGGQPATFPSLSVKRIQINPPGGSPAGVEFALSTTDPQFFPTPGGGGAGWFQSGNVQQLQYTTNQNFTIDNHNYIYFLRLTDETGAGSHAGNLYFSVTCTYNNIQDLRPVV